MKPTEELVDLVPLGKINFKLIEENSKKLAAEVESWKANPLTEEEMIAQYERLHGGTD